jgi:hypothetical protein
MLTESQLSKVGNFDTDTIANLRPALDGGTESLSAAGALDRSKFTSELAVTGTLAFTLAAPTVAGQRKRVVCTLAASTPLGTLTVSSPDDTAGFVCSATFVFNAVGQSIEFVATSSLKWRAIRIVRAGVLPVVVGTTVLTGLNLSHNYALSVTGTVVSATTRGLPNGSAVGEICLISNPTAASTPVGSITWTGLSLIGVASTDIQAIGATTDTVLCQWTGSAWQAISAAGVTFA